MYCNKLVAKLESNSKYNQILEIIDEESRKHCIRTAELTEYLAGQLELTREDKLLLVKAAYLHDIGKYYIPLSILEKAGPLTKIERMVIDMHSYFGYKHLMDAGIDKRICQIVLYHHGTKKPKLEPIETEERFVFLGKILQTADAYDALTTKRSYHAAKEKNVALEIMRTEGFQDNVINLLP